MIRSSSPLAVALAVTASLWATWARALVWPDVAERVEADLGAADVATRRAAAQDIAALGRKRGTPLALLALGDSDDEVRLAAADAAMRLRFSGATDAAMAWLNASDPRLRKKACDVARSLPNRRAVVLLARTLGDPDPEVRGAAADALGRQESPDAVAPLLGRLDDPTPSVRVQIVEALAHLGNPRAVLPLVGKVQDSSQEVRQTVARALGDLGNARASPALALALRDQSGDVRREALTALGRMRAVDAVDAITPFAAERSASLRVAALGALGRIASADAVRVLVGSLGSLDDAMVSLERNAVRDALVVAGGPAVPALRELLAGSPTPASATSAAWVLGELRAKAEAPTIVAAMRRGALPVAAALHALAGAGTALDVPVVLEFVADANPAVRAEAIAAAMALLDPRRPDGRIVEPLAAALRDPRPSLQDRALIAKLLGRTGAPRASPILVPLIRAPDPALRLAAIDALGTLGPAGGQVDAALVGAIASPDATVRLHAALALSQSGTSQARDALLKALDGGEEVDRASVLMALGGTLARAPAEGAVAQLAGALELAAGPERDALIEAIGRAPLTSAVRALVDAAATFEPADRRAAATLLAGHDGDTRALAAVRLMLADRDATVRAQAAWALGTLGGGGDIARLESVARGESGPDLDTAINATAAIGRIATRTRGAEQTAAARALCALASESRAYVRANALAGIGRARARCADDLLARRLLRDDGSDEVRAAAAIAVAAAAGLDADAGRASGEDRFALERCARSDSSGAVAARCGLPSIGALIPLPAQSMLVYVVPESGRNPQPGSAYALLLADGLIRAGVTDRRGAVFDPLAPQGEVTLLEPGIVAQ